MEATLHQDPPDPPELPAGAERPPAWPAWFALVGFLVGLAGTLLFAIVLGLVAALLGSDTDTSDSSPALVVVGTLAQGVAFALTAVFFASRVARPSGGTSGCAAPRCGRRSAGRPSGWCPSTSSRPSTPRSCSPTPSRTRCSSSGGDQGTLGLIVAGLMVIVVAPVAEEIFFRGFFYRALRSRFADPRRRA